MNKEIIIYGANWCKDCTKAKELLDERNIPFTFLDITDSKHGKEYSQIIMDLNDGKRIIPTLIIGDDYYANPRPSELNNILDNMDTCEEELTLCSNGNILQNGDTVLLTRDLDVKGSQLNLKQGTVLEKIKLTGNPVYIDVRIGKSTIAVKTEFIKKKG